MVSEAPSRAERALLLVAVALIGLNLRPFLTPASYADAMRLAEPDARARPISTETEAYSKLP